ncbi:MAG: PIG-L family deacetylase [Bacteroidales bacterium]|nr:PIG-L family deacetylase [Bacteroidales bacterium]MBS3776108.1 PIG-L family deacetylase [Bacteroidales bacterium]
MNIMIIAAHPDDEVFSIGGTIATHTMNGDDVYILNLTNGEPTPYGTVETRLKEAEEADRILKIRKRIIMDFPNRYLEDTIDNRKKVAAQIREYKPDILLVQYHVDQHPDHISASELGTAARFYAKLTKSDIPGEPHYPRKILYYYTSHFRLNMSPSFILPVSEEAFKMKMEAGNAYQSQLKNQKRIKLGDRLEWSGRYYGALINSPYGEPFYTPEAVGINTLHNIV